MQSWGKLVRVGQATLSLLVLHGTCLNDRKCSRGVLPMHFVLCPQAAAAAAFTPTPATGWWGAKMFMSAGLLEGMDQDQKSRERGFDEDLQTKVYMDAHNAQRQGKKGLGKSTTLKIAGVFGQKAGVRVGEGGMCDSSQHDTKRGAG